ncbi:MAG: flagellar hook-associated protein FlgK [Oscillospiraceae bacterium]|nr:flagellar hook-associated protein FlgK [Oscillospiraceae bacterium]
MAVGFASYEIARSGLTFNERGLNATGHNIANVNTLGFSRQQAIAANSFYIKNNAKYGWGQVGIGVDVQQTRQIRHKFLDNIYRYENAKADYWHVRSQTFSEIENILGEPINQGLQSLLNRYWDAWQELSKDPSSLTTRSLVRQLGESIAFEMNNVGAQFDRMQLELDAQFCDGIRMLGELCEKVADLNRLIKSVQIAGEAPNDYMDARNLLLDQISSLIDCEIYERDDGMHDVISNGIYLVYRDDAKRLLTMQTPETGMFHKAFVVMREGSPPVLEEMVFGQCKLKGILESRGDFVSLPDISAQNGPYDPADPLGSMIRYDVMFGRGSITNGSPNTIADIVIAIDLSDASSAYLEQLKMDIDSYVDGLFKKGLDFNLKLVTTSGGAAALVGEYTKEQANDFIADVLSLAPAVGANPDGFGGAGGVLDVLENDVTYREFANRYTVLFTADSIDGPTAVTEADAAAYAQRLHGIGMSLSVVAASELHYDGDGLPTAPFGWAALTAATGGASIDYDEVVGNERRLRDFAAVMQDANDFINRSVNDRISMIPTTEQILPEARRRVNALINIICRSVNELHRGGKTLEVPPRDGEDFFVPINPIRPLELGNIAINPKFLEPEGLNYIVASQSGATEDNLIARAIANLRNAPRTISAFVGEMTFDDYYRDAIFVISNQAAESERYLKNQITVASQLDLMRHSIMDVSMDEELSNMMKFKFGYDAAARVLNVIDNMIETVVTRLGHVGR